MAEAYYLVHRNTVTTGRSGMIDGIHSVVANIDDGSTQAEAIADATAMVIAAGHPIPSDYFDAATLLTTLLPDDTDALIFIPDGYKVEEA